MTKQFAATGAFQLVLDRVARLQPRERNAAGWSEWEALRCSALDALGRHADLLGRLSALPPDDAPAGCMPGAARGYFALQRHADARRAAARALWQPGVSPGDGEALRRLVIDTYVAERRGEEAYRAMLRYQQDHGPLTRDVAGRFVSGLLALGMDKAALDWLPQLGETHPARVALRVRAGLVSTDAAVAQARAALAKGADPTPWAVLLDSLSGAEQRALRVAVYEQSLDRGAGPEAPAAAQTLWNAYLAAASDIANRSGLLVGDDAAWMDYAGRRLGADPVVARALFAHLARHAQAAGTRHNAQLQLLYSYQSDRLERVALKVFDAQFPDIDALDSQVRYRLGAIAETAGAAASALRYWRDLPAPPDASAGEWLLRLSRQRLRAGEDDVGADALARHYAAEKSPPAASVQEAVRYAEALNEAGRHAAARTLLLAVQPHATGAQSRVLLGLGRAHEGAGGARARGRSVSARGAARGASGCRGGRRPPAGRGRACQSRIRERCARAARLGGAQRERSGHGGGRAP